MTVFMGLPIVSISLFLVAGIAIGYLVWYRDRSEDEKRILELEERYAAANGAAEMHRQEFLEAKKSLNIQGSDLEQFRLLKTDVDEATQHIREELAAEVSRSESLALELQEARAAGQSIEDLQSRNEDVIREAGDELGRQTAMIEQQSSEITRKSEEIEELKRQLEAVSDDSAAEELTNQLREENVQLQSQIESLRISRAAEDDDLKAELQSKETENAELQSQIESLLNSQAVGDENLRAELESKETQNAELQSRIERHTAEDERLKIELQSKEDQIAELKSQIDNFSDEDYPSVIDQLRTQLAQASEQTEQAVSQNDVLNGVVAEKEARINELQVAMEKQNEVIQRGNPTEAMKAEYDRMSEQFETATTKNNDMRVTLGEQAKQIALLLKEQDAMKSVRDENVQLANRLGAAEVSNEELKLSLAAKLNEFSETTAGLQSTMEGKDKEIEQLKKTEDQMKRLKSELDNAARLVKTANDENIRVNNLVSERQAEIADLKNQLAEVNKLRSELEAASKDVEKQQSVHRELRVYNEKQAAEIARLNEELQGTLVLEKQLSQSASDLKEMRHQSELQTKAFAEQRNEVQQLRATLADYETTKKRLQQASDQVTATQAERQRLAETRLDLEKQVKKLSTQVAMQGNDTEDLRRQLDTKTKAYEKAIANSQQFAASIKQQETALNSLEKKLRSAQTLQPENERLKDKVAELMAALKDLSAEHEGSLAANAKAQTTVRDLQNEVHEHTKTIRDLRRPRGGIFQFGEDEQSDRRAA